MIGSGPSPEIAGLAGGQAPISCASERSSSHRGSNAFPDCIKLLLMTRSASAATPAHPRSFTGSSTTGGRTEERKVDGSENEFQRDTMGSKSMRRRGRVHARQCWRDKVTLMDESGDEEI